MFRRTSPNMRRTISVESEDAPQLSAETFLALHEFYMELEQCEANAANHLRDDFCEFTEDWQLSQFWYDQPTIDTLVRLVLASIYKNGKIALISCPSLYRRMRKEAGDDCLVHLYEYDKRFAIFGEDFSFYDYTLPLEVPRDRRNFYDLVIADPPFLSDECLAKTAVTVKYLTSGKIILCTGAIMENMAHKLLALRKTSFEPRHRNNLGNEFCCFANYDINPFL